MEITSLKEFYEKSDNKDIALYQEYLASAKKEIIEGLDEAKKLFGEKDSVVDQLQGKISAIESLETVIKNSIKELVSNSIVMMSDKELEKIIDTCIDNMKKECKILSKKSEELKEKIDEKNEEHRYKMYELGYKNAYFEADDTSKFFEDIKSAEDFMMDLVKSELDEESLKEIFLPSCFANSVYFANALLADAILSLRKIAKVSDDDILKRAVNAYLTRDKVTFIIGESDERECLKAFELSQKKLKLKTEFFNNLPDSLKKELQDNGVVDCQAYNRLASIYSQYKKDGYVVRPENEEVLMYKAEQEKVKETIAELESKIESAKLVLYNSSDMIALIETLVEFHGDEELSYINVSPEVLKRTEKSFDDRIKELSEKLENLDNIKGKLDMLLSYDIDFKVLNAKREYKRRNDSGENDKKIVTIAKVERRRLRQFKILSTGIIKLKEIQKQIEEVDKKRNISKKSAKKDLLGKYNKTVKSVYDSLYQEDLLCINVVRNNEEIIYMPVNFDAFLEHPNLLKYVFDDDLFEEMVERGLFISYQTIDGINHSNDVLFDLANELYKHTKRLDGTYDFAISSVKIEKLMALQEELVSLYESLQSKREAEIAMSCFEINPIFKQLIKDLGMSLDTVTLQDVEDYHEEVKKQIYDINTELIDLRRKISNFDYIASQYELLNGFEETYLSSDELKKNIRFSC